MCQQTAYDTIINAEVFLQHGYHVHTDKVLQHNIGTNGTIAGQYDDDPGLNSIVYDIEFPDGTVHAYSANVITENMLTQMNDDDFTMKIMQGVIDHKMDTTAVSKFDRYAVTLRGRKKLRKPTYPWKLLVTRKDESESWILLKYLKEYHPIKLAEYSKSRGTANETAFIFWVPYTLRKEM